MNNRSFYYLGFMLDFSKSYSDMAQRILIATQTLIANEGLSKVSTHKVAKQAEISVGTIYVHFKNKDDLLNQLIYFLFQQHNLHLSQNYDPKLPLAEQYNQFWENHWAFLQKYPDAVVNMYQYEALTQLNGICQDYVEMPDLPYHLFISQGKKEKIIADLPIEIIYELTLQVATSIAYTQIMDKKQYGIDVLDKVKKCTWKAITI
ncbi:MAG: TetR/AcrR family transcriptional regulator [Pasteurella sp.]|nr:TetR/AcrR family transcriptional regulator [Pasteurella sp.]